MIKKLSIILLPMLIVLFAGLVVFLSPKKDSVPKKISSEQVTSVQVKDVEKKPHPDSIPALAERSYDGSDLKLEKILDDNPSYLRYSITYLSEGLKISGIMNIPKGKGPFPVLFLNHGYIDPKIYTNGQGLKREQDFFARNGYAVLHSDYRGHAFSDPDPDENVRPRSHYVEDVLNAISAVKKADLPSLDKENLGILGHSMGGGISINIMVTKPEIAKAYVLLAPISSDYKKNFERWVVPDSDFDGVAQKVYARYGTYEEQPEIWESFSAKNYLDRVQAPIMLHQGTLDRDVPVEWSRDLEKLLREKDKEITYYEYPLEGHTFYDAQSLVMQRSLVFFDKQLKDN